MESNGHRQVRPASPSVCDAEDYSSQSSASPMSVSSSECSSPLVIPEDSLDSPLTCSSSRSASPAVDWWQDYPPYTTYTRVRWYRDDRGLWKENPRLPQRSPYGRPVASPSQSDIKVTCEKLLETIRKGSAQEIESCLKRASLNLNVLGVAGDSPLHAGCRSGKLDVVKALVRHGADPQLANRDGWSPIHLALWGGYQDVALYLLSLSRR